MIFFKWKTLGSYKEKFIFLNARVIIKFHYVKKELNFPNSAIIECFNYRNEDYRVLTKPTVRFYSEFVLKFCIAIKKNQFTAPTIHTLLHSQHMQCFLLGVSHLHD